jgi:transposase
MAAKTSTSTATTTTRRARCECCGAELPPRKGRGRPRQYCGPKCTELAKRIERARVLMAEILEDAPSATRGRAFARMRGLVGRLEDDLIDAREDYGTHQPMKAAKASA